jgi:predicted Zn-dependent peptidase
MKKFPQFASRLIALMVLVGFSLTGFAYRYEYQTVPNDPTKALIYNLPNGLKVYMSVNKDRPRIKTIIGVRVGSKNDPAETTGLAHYFEHLMFKGTETFGTQNYAAEKPMLDQIEQLFETYRFTTDSLQRAQIYHQIDSISYQASLIAIPNEYDKLMATIGSEGTNAFTSYDQTCYVENIPANQIENWAKVQSDRFTHPVLRGFHTELEAVYEEKNMTMTSDMNKVIDKMLALLYPHHPYGTQTVIGTQEHLKNPSITNIKNYFNQWYVPNNMAIAMVGDLDPDNVIDILSKYFGSLTPNYDLPKLSFEKETPITAPITAEVKGLESEMTVLAWRMPGKSDEDIKAINLLDAMLNNGRSGLIDLNVTQQQAMLGCETGLFGLADYSAYMAIGLPKEGQSLQEVQQILLEQIAKLRNGEFSEELVTAAVNNYNLALQSLIEDNDDLASTYIASFIDGQEWSDNVNRMLHIGDITKADIVALANKYLGDNNYVIVNKLQAKDDSELKIAKPKITPIASNRDVESPFVTAIKNSTVTPIEPHFVDFDTELNRSNVKNDQVELLYNRNVTNDLFKLTFVYDYGYAADKPLYLPSYTKYLGTTDMTAEEIQTKFYTLGCNFSITTGQERSRIVLSGLAKNMAPALELMEHVINNYVPDKEVWDEYVEMTIKDMNDDKSDQDECRSRLRSYAKYGPDNNPELQLAYMPDQLRQLSPKTVTDAFKALNTHRHRVIYYGPMAQSDVEQMLETKHQTPETLTEAPKNRRFEPLVTTEPVIYLAQFDTRQLNMGMISNRGDLFDPAQEPYRELFDTYFSDGMNSIVFQEMRETRSLCYQANGGVNIGNRFDDPYVCTTFIGTQNDKLIDAIDAFTDILNNMPQSQAAFEIARNNLEATIRTSRTIKNSIAWSWISRQDYKLDHSVYSELFKLLPTLTLDDVVAYQKAHVKDRTYTYYILGDLNDLDLEGLKKYGRLVILDLPTIFGY